MGRTPTAGATAAARARDAIASSNGTGASGDPKTSRARRGAPRGGSAGRRGSRAALRRVRAGRDERRRARASLCAARRRGVGATGVGGSWERKTQRDGDVALADPRRGHQMAARECRPITARGFRETHRRRVKTPTHPSLASSLVWVDSAKRRLFSLLIDVWCTENVRLRARCCVLRDFCAARALRSGGERGARPTGSALSARQRTGDAVRSTRARRERARPPVFDGPRARSERARISFARVEGTTAPREEH